ncbi:alpha/beta fold hydrolase [Marinactinospora thermotolerans]|uniref:Lipase n=1 Tax=Marinactinospora thermotolerans DSM 45154 TaxID=1122192 RepID=A0A1T4ST20_9ACTN|nr:alpha/beta hydrolase [Marinactinospora thermotolerans]SKA31450.1 lipase [Marinactinospora thermotolerans DSM 45154]
MSESPLHVHVFGPPTGAPTVMLHGIQGHGGRWRRFAAEQLPEARVYAPDLRGHGRSTWRRPWTLERHAADVTALLDGLPAGPVDLVGHSFGAAVALHVANAVPDRLRALVLLDPAIGLPAATATRETGPAPSFADPDEARAVRAASWPDATPGAVDDEVDDHLVQGDDGRWRWRFAPEAVAAARAEMVRPHVTPPAGLRTLLVVAGRADLVRPGFLADCRARSGGHLEETVLDCGHMVYVERPAELGALLRRFLRAGGGPSEAAAG